LTTPVSSNEESELLSFNKNNWYFGIGLGESKHEYTESDLEFTGLDNQVVDFSDNAGKIFAGYKASNSFSIEGGYVDLGKSSRSGSSSSGGNTDNASGYDEYYGLNIVGVGNMPVNNKISLIVKGGLFKWWNHSVVDVSGSGQVFENQNDSDDTFDGTVFTYGIGIDANVSNNISLRAEYEVFDDIFSDYIDNIDGGYIKKDIDLVTLNLIYHFDNNRDIDYIENKSRSPLYVLAMYGNSANKARMSGGRYDGPIWNLKTNTRRATDVSGDMSDDKSSKAYKIAMGYKVDSNISIEGGYIDLGIVKSKSAENAITGGGNALTGSMTAQTDGLFIAGLLNKEISNDVSVFIEGGIFYWEVDSEIYNNLDFNGVGGNRRGWIENDKGLSPLLGIGVDYKLNDRYKIRIGFDRLFNIGTNDTTGEGDIDLSAIGMVYDF